MKVHARLAVGGWQHHLVFASGEETDIVSITDQATGSRSL